VSCAKTAEPIEMPFWMPTEVDPGNHALDRVQILMRRGNFGMQTRLGPTKHILDGGAHWRQLANTTEPSVCGGDASLCQITLTTHRSRPTAYV